MKNSENLVNFEKVYRVVWQGRLTIALMTMIFFGLSYFYEAKREKSYKIQAEIQNNPYDFHEFYFLNNFLAEKHIKFSINNEKVKQDFIIAFETVLEAHRDNSEKIALLSEVNLSNINIRTTSGKVKKNFIEIEQPDKKELNEILKLSVEIANKKLTNIYIEQLRKIQKFIKSLTNSEIKRETQKIKDFYNANQNFSESLLGLNQSFAQKLKSNSGYDFQTLPLLHLGEYYDKLAELTYDQQDNTLEYHINYLNENYIEWVRINNRLVSPNHNGVIMILGGTLSGLILGLILSVYRNLYLKK